MNTFFLKGRNLTLETVFALDEHNGEETPHKFVGTFEVIAFSTFLDYENFCTKGRETFFELFDIEPNVISKTLFSEETGNNAFLFVSPRLGMKRFTNENTHYFSVTAF